MTDFIEAVVQPIRTAFEEKDRQYAELLTRFDKLQRHAVGLEKKIEQAEKSGDASLLSHLSDVDDQNEELRVHVAYLSDLLVRICGFAESEQADDAGRWSMFFKEVDSVAQGVMSMRSDAWLGSNFVEMSEYQRVCDDLVTANAMMSDYSPDESREELEAGLLKSKAAYNDAKAAQLKAEADLARVTEERDEALAEVEHHIEAQANQSQGLEMVDVVRILDRTRDRLREAREERDRLAARVSHLEHYFEQKRRENDGLDDGGEG